MCLHTELTSSARRHLVWKGPSRLSLKMENLSRLSLNTSTENVSRVYLSIRKTYLSRRNLSSEAHDVTITNHSEAVGKTTDSLPALDPLLGSKCISSHDEIKVWRAAECGAPSARRSQQEEALLRGLAAEAESRPTKSWKALSL